MTEVVDHKSVSDARSELEMDCALVQSLASMIWADGHDEVQGQADGMYHVRVVAYELKNRLATIERNVDVLFNAWRDLRRAQNQTAGTPDAK